MSALPAETIRRAKSAATNPFLRENAAWILDVCHSAAYGNFLLIEEVEGPSQAAALARVAFEAAFRNGCRCIGDTCGEAAGLLRDGWSPGDRVVPLRRSR